MVVAIMALNNISIYSLNKKAIFCTTAVVHNPKTGVNKEQLVPAFTLWCMPYTRTIGQQASLAPEQLDQPIIVVRHNRQITAQMKVKYDGIDYNIANISPDDINQIITYDYITLKKVAK